MAGIECRSEFDSQTYGSSLLCIWSDYLAIFSIQTSGSTTECSKQLCIRESRPAKSRAQSIHVQRHGQVCRPIESVFVESQRSGGSISPTQPILPGQTTAPRPRQRLDVIYGLLHDLSSHRPKKSGRISQGGCSHPESGNGYCQHFQQSIKHGSADQEAVG